MGMGVEDLENDFYEKEETHRALARKRREERDERLRAFERQLDAELAQKYDAELMRLAVETQKAREAFEAAREAAASEKPWTYPPGTRMVEWEYRFRFHTKPSDRKLTGRVGVLEIITANSEHGNRADYRQAGRGDMVVRILKKNGSPSKMYVSGWDLNRWVPEGTDIKQSDLSWTLLREEEE